MIIIKVQNIITFYSVYAWYCRVAQQANASESHPIRLVEETVTDATNAELEYHYHLKDGVTFGHCVSFLLYDTTYNYPVAEAKIIESSASTSTPAATHTNDNYAESQVASATDDADCSTPVEGQVADTGPIITLLPLLLKVRLLLKPRMLTQSAPPLVQVRLQPRPRLTVMTGQRGLRGQVKRPKVTLKEMNLRG
jgi:hypothetical protein